MLTREEKEELAFLIRQDINDGTEALNETAKVLQEKHSKSDISQERINKDNEVFGQVCEGHNARVKKLRSIANKLGIEL